MKDDLQNRPNLLTRRRAVAALGAGIAALWGAPSSAQTPPAAVKPKLGDDGLFHMDWYLESFLDLSEDLTAATASGKRFAILWGLKGCPSCKRLHEVHMLDPEIAGYIRDNFVILHLNHIGSREVTDFDGRKRGEKAFGEAYGIRFTPTVQFFPEKVEGLAALSGQAREVARMPGLLEPKEFLAMFRFVREKGYESAPFTEWLKKQA